MPLRLGARVARPFLGSAGIELFSLLYCISACSLTVMLSQKLALHGCTGIVVEVVEDVNDDLILSAKAALLRRGSHPRQRTRFTIPCHRRSKIQRILLLLSRACPANGGCPLEPDASSVLSSSSVWSTGCFWPPFGHISLFYKIDIIPRHKRNGIRTSQLVALLLMVTPTLPGVAAKRHI